MADEMQNSAQTSAARGITEEQRSDRSCRANRQATSGFSHLILAHRQQHASRVQWMRTIHRGMFLLPSRPVGDKWGVTIRNVFVLVLFLALATVTNRVGRPGHAQTLSFDSTFLGLFKYSAYYRYDSVMYQSNIQFPTLSTQFFRKEEVLLGHPHCEAELLGQPIRLGCYGADPSVYFDSTPAFQIAFDEASARGRDIEQDGDYSIRRVRWHAGLSFTFNGNLHLLRTL